MELETTLLKEWNYSNDYLKFCLDNNQLMHSQFNIY